MGKTKRTPRLVRVEIWIPESLSKFVEDWSNATGEKKNDIAQSIFSHGLTSICAENDWKPALVDRVAPILEDLVACSGEDTEILHVHLGQEVTYHRGNDKRH